MSQGDSLYALGDYAGAINAYAKMGTEGSSLQIGRAYNAMGNHAKAMAEYSALLERSPKLSLARFELGKLYFKTKNFGPAGELFNLLALQGPPNPEYHYNLGRTMESLGNRKGANGEFHRAIALDSTHIRSLYALAKYFTAAGEKDSVLDYVERGLRLYRDDVSMINLKALALYNQGEYRAAIPNFERLLALGEQHPFLYRNLARCYFRTLDYEKAIDNYRILMEFPQYRAAAHSGLGEVFLKESLLDSAQYHIEKSISEQRVVLDREYADLGRIARLKGDTKGALDLYTTAWRENEENYLYLYQICILADEYYNDPRTRLGHYEKLLESYPQIPDFIGERAKKRISELREEIHYGNP